ncbi:MAG: ABC transporter substrate-binding protein, partial [Treponema sp.]|nr:ABC transporter substrate-binding protein [Treponema sp.]
PLVFALALVPLSLFGGGKAGAAAKPEVKAELRYGFTSEPATLDPLSPANTADGRSILFNVYEGLVKADTDGKLQPALASEYRIEQGGLVYRFTIRQGISFHDGSPLTAEDAKFTLEAAIEANFRGFTQIDRIDVSGNTLTLTLKAPDPEFLPYLTQGIVPRNNPDREKNPVGTGPFSIESYTVQQSLVLKKNPNYWKPGFPKLDKVTVVFVADSDALLLSLRGGNVDGAGVTSSTVQQLDPSRFDVVTGYSNSVQLLALNNASPPLDDVRVRQAISYAVDVPQIIDTAFYGQGEASGSPLIPGLTAYYEDSLRNPSRDTDRAKKLLSEAGHPSGFPLEISVPSNYTMHVDTAQVIVNQLKTVGINASIRLVDWATWLGDVYRGRKYQATIVSLDDSVPLTPRGFLGRYLSTSGSNFINFNNPDYDRVYNAAVSEPDEARRIGLYKEAQRIIAGSAASVYIQDIYSFKVFAKGRYSGAVNYPLYVIDFSTISANTN